MSNISKNINNILEKICIFAYFVMTIVMLGQVFFRYVLNYGIPWAEEVSKFMLVWLGFLGSAIVFYEQRHVSIDFLIEKLSSKNLRLVKIIQLFLSLFFFIYLFRYGYDYAVFGIKLKSPATEISRFWPQLSIPVGSFFLIFHSISLIYERLFIKTDNGKIDQLKKDHQNIIKNQEPIIEEKRG